MLECSLTLPTGTQAEQFLAAANGDIQQAASLFFEGSGAQEADSPSASDTNMAGDDDTTQPTAPSAAHQPGGGRTLGGAYVPPSESSSASSSKAASRQRQPQRGLRTLKDLQSGGGEGGHGHDHDDDDEDDEHRNHDFFTGGEKSGLAVQNPGANSPADHISNIMRRARQ
jgi:UBX domain-containing protein 1